MTAVPVSADVALKQPAPLRNWLAVVTVAIGIFSLMTTELLPVGLLTTVGAALGASDGAVGLMVTVPGIVAAVAAPTLAVIAGRLDRRLMLCLLMALLAAANLLSALAPNFGILLASRVLVGFSIGGFWTIAGGLAVRLVPAHSVGRAMSVIFGGVAVASVLGVPAGTFIGDLSGWRAAFAVLGGLSLAVLAALVVLLPPLPSSHSLGVRALTRQFRDSGVRAGVIATFCLVTGQFTAYTFVSPILQHQAGFDVKSISSLLFVYGVAGVIANFVSGPAAARDVRRTLSIIVAALGSTLLVMPVFAIGPYSAIVLLIGWGLAYGGVSVSLQTWMLKAAPQAAEAATSLLVAMFNLSIALGALLGGCIVDASGTRVVLWVGGALVLLAGTSIWPARRFQEARREEL